MRLVVPALAAVALVGCEEHGSGGGPGADASAPSSDLAGPARPRLCTGGEAGDPTCPINILPLPKQRGATVQFVAQALGGGIFLSDMKVDGGQLGVFVVHPRLVTRTAGSPALTPDPGDRFANLVADIPPGGAVLLDTAALVQFAPDDEVGMQFDEVSPFRGRE
ncbi:MAG: hypothetical protein KIT31_37485 [Deltaproteobacteria bacterium]|nr:hypothetical protein [Deltaproteobacteria bacterium]